MPHKPSPARDSVTFVSCNLTNDQKPVLAQWAERNTDDMWKHLESLIAGGYRYSVKEQEADNPKNSVGYTANLAPMRQNSPNKGRILQEWGSTPARATLKLLWAHLEYFHLEWPAGREAPTDDW